MRLFQKITFSALYLLTFTLTNSMEAILSNASKRTTSVMLPKRKISVANSQISSYFSSRKELMKRERTFEELLILHVGLPTRKWDEYGLNLRELINFIEDPDTSKTTKYYRRIMTKPDIYSHALTIAYKALDKFMKRQAPHHLYQKVRNELHEHAWSLFHQCIYADLFPCKECIGFSWYIDLRKHWYYEQIIIAIEQLFKESPLKSPPKEKNEISSYFEEAFLVFQYAMALQITDLVRLHEMGPFNKEILKMKFKQETRDWEPLKTLRTLDKIE